jgi:ketosteroid isomerase-like protein
MSNTQRFGIETEIRELLSHHSQAISRKNAAEVLACAMPDAVTYSLAPPLVAPADGGQGLRDWFTTWRGDIGLDLHDTKIVAADEVAYAYGLTHLTGTKTDGQKVDVWFRQTFGLRKINGSWRIAHDHESVPFYMDGSVRAAVDLKP